MIHPLSIKFDYANVYNLGRMKSYDDMKLGLFFYDMKEYCDIINDAINPKQIINRKKVFGIF